MPPETIDITDIVGEIQDTFEIPPRVAMAMARHAKRVRKPTTRTTNLANGYGRAKVTTIDAGRIALEVCDMGVEMSPSQARKLAKLLLDAADLG